MNVDQIFCDHDYELTHEHTTESKFEVSARACNGHGNLPWQLCDASRKYIQTFKCTKCNKLKRYVEVV